MSSQARGLQNFISDLRNAKSKVRIVFSTPLDAGATRAMAEIRRGR